MPAPDPGRETLVTPRRRGHERIAFVAIIAVAAALRLLHLSWGLPSVLEEAMPLRVALGMIDPATGHVNPNPGFFNYPSLSIYLHLAVASLVYGVERLLGMASSWADFLLGFELDPTPVLVAARLVHAAADLATVVAAHRIARRFSPTAGWLALLLTAFSPLLLTTARTLIVDTLMTALLAWSFERLMAWQIGGARRDLITSAVLLGLAASTKYPAIAVTASLLVAVLPGGRRALPLMLGALAVTVGTLIATSPYLLLDAHTALRDLAFERQHAASGHLGSSGPLSLLFHLRNLATTVGPPGLALLVLAPWLLRDRTDRRLALPLMAGFVVLFAPIALVRNDAERYLAAAVPIAVVLIAASAGAVGRRWVRRRPAWIGGALALGLLAPVVVAGTRSAAGGFVDTRGRALAWCARHLPERALIVEEAWSVPLVSETLKQELAGRPCYRHASAATRRRFDLRVGYHVVSIPIRVTGTVALSRDGRSVPAPDLNAAYYDPALHAAADYVITSGAVRGRYEADSIRFRAPLRFYALLDRTAEPVARFAPDPRASGPEIRIYRITPACRRELRGAGLGDDWWKAALPATAPGTAAGDEPELRSLYARYYAPFADEMACASLARGDTLTAERLSRISAAQDPSDVTAAIVYGIGLGSRHAWREAAGVLERALAHNPDAAAMLMLQLARVEARLGRNARQRAYLAEVREREPAGSPLRRRAEAELLALDPGPSVPITTRP